MHENQLELSKILKGTLNGDWELEMRKVKPWKYHEVLLLSCSIERKSLTGKEEARITDG
jgi:hypothetical protein